MHVGLRHDIRSEATYLLAHAALEEGGPVGEDLEHGSYLGEAAK